MDLISLPTELDKKKIDSRYKLVEAVTKRARGLYHGAMPKIASKSKRMTTVPKKHLLSLVIKICWMKLL
jgi:DNA-directed RNA polymerase subunit K/omega